MAITVVQSLASTSQTPSFVSPTTGGNCVVVAIASFAPGGGVTGVTLGGAADNFAQATPNSFAVSPRAWIWVDWNCAGGQTAIAISGVLNVSAGQGGVFIYEVSGLLATSGVVDQAAAADDSPNYSSGATATTTTANEIWFGCADGNNPCTVPGAPWTSLGNGTEGIAGYQIVSSTGTATWAGTTSSNSGACVVTLAAPSGTGASAGNAASTGAPPAAAGAVAIGMTIRGI